MIKSDDGLRQALEQLSKTYQALAALRAEYPGASQKWLAVLSEGFLDHARQLQREIEDYTGVSAVEPSRSDDERSCNHHEGSNATTAASSLFHSNPDILGGTPVFVGTRVPVRTLLDYLEAGDSLDKFLKDFPSVTRDQAVAALRLAGQMLVAHTTPA